MSDSNEFYANLKKQLEETTEFPAEYLYKFIVPNDENQVVKVENLFEGTKAEINKKTSKTGKYTSISILINLPDSSVVISYYKKVEKIKGIVSL